MWVAWRNNALNVKCQVKYRVTCFLLLKAHCPVKQGNSNYTIYMINNAWRPRLIIINQFSTNSLPTTSSVYDMLRSDFSIFVEYNVFCSTLLVFLMKLLSIIVKVVIKSIFFNKLATVVSTIITIGKLEGYG